MVMHTGLMLSDALRDLLMMEDPLPLQPLATQEVGHHGREWSAQPLCHGNSESFLGARNG